MENLEKYLDRDLFLGLLKEAFAGTYNEKTKHYEINFDNFYLRIMSEHLKDKVLEKIEDYFNGKMPGKIKKETSGESGK